MRRSSSLCDEVNCSSDFKPREVKEIHTWRP
jgi:hypothetical protein